MTTKATNTEPFDKWERNLGSIWIGCRVQTPEGKGTIAHELTDGLTDVYPLGEDAFIVRLDSGELELYYESDPDLYPLEPGHI